MPRAVGNRGRMSKAGQHAIPARGYATGTMSTNDPEVDTSVFRPAPRMVVEPVLTASTTGTS